jgi:hypothetical protein
VLFDDQQNERATLTVRRDAGLLELEDSSGNRITP